MGGYSFAFPSQTSGTLLFTPTTLASCCFSTPSCSAPSNDLLRAMQRFWKRITSKASPVHSRTMVTSSTLGCLSPPSRSQLLCLSILSLAFQIHTLSSHFEIILWCQIDRWRLQSSWLSWYCPYSPTTIYTFILHHCSLLCPQRKHPHRGTPSEKKKKNLSGGAEGGSKMQKMYTKEGRYKDFYPLAAQWFCLTDFYLE